MAKNHIVNIDCVRVPFIPVTVPFPTPEAQSIAVVGVTLSPANPIVNAVRMNLTLTFLNPDGSKFVSGLPNI